MNSGTMGYATVNSSGMDVLFPSSAAIPNQLDYHAYIAQMVSSSENWVQLRLNDISLEQFDGGTGEVSRSYTNDTVRSLRKSGTIKSFHNAPNKVNGTSVRYMDLTLWFMRYEFSAQKIGNGIKSVNVSSSTAYEGESVTFTAEIIDGADWKGWYSDSSCSNLVSTSKSYTITASSDITLYAKASKDTLGTGLYLKKDGTYSEVLAIYEKQNGVWVETDKSVIDSSKHYKYITS